ncbi:MAG: DUF4262 domain-containing protein [Bacteroidetes bacterium]|nr:DUF4262 domain-containing protein [Bacteroidota bacterium]
MKKFTEDIEKYGWTVVMIKETDYLPAFAYTIGIWETYSKPEIIAFGLSTQNLHILVNQAGDIIKSGNEIEKENNYSDFFEDSNVQFIEVDSENISDYFGYAIEYYGSKYFPAIQLIWTDRQNKFPWETEFEEDLIFKQPLLDRNMNFKFREHKNLGVFTTKQFLEENKPIIRVTHDEDGDWQFLTENAELKDAKIVHLGHLIEKDKTLNELFRLDYGESAERNFIGDNWRESLE